MSGGKSDWVQGWMAPVGREVASGDLPVTGSIPRELNGKLLRIGPNPISDPGPGYQWFSGEGMVHSIQLEDGRAVEYRNRWVRTPDVCRQLGESSSLGDLGFLDVANTNVLDFAGILYALTESCTPYRLGSDLATLGREEFGLDAPPHFTAHPHLDPLSGDWHAVGYTLDSQAAAEYFVIGADHKAKSREAVQLRGPAAVHDFGMTQSHILFFDLPLLFDNQLAEAGSAIPYRWMPSHESRVGVLRRGSEAVDVRWFHITPGWVFHTMNAYDVTDDNGEVTKIVWDVVRYEKIFDNDVSGPGDPYPPQLYRWEIDLANGRVAETQLDARVQEFPRIDERRWSQSYRYGYTTEIMNTAGGSSILAHDLEGDPSSFELLAGHHLSEPVFVPRSESSAENDGWILVVDHDDAKQQSELMILEAADVASGPVARVSLPQRIPAGFHGNWVSA